MLRCRDAVTAVPCRRTLGPSSHVTVCPRSLKAVWQSRTEVERVWRPYCTIMTTIAVPAVVVVLMLGLWNMMRGKSANLSQKLMRWRVGLQFRRHRHHHALHARPQSLMAEQAQSRCAGARFALCCDLGLTGESRAARMVVLNKIYTRTGDAGTTALGSGERVPKHALRIAAYGTVDETNASHRHGARTSRRGQPGARRASSCASRTISSISAPTCACPTAAPSPSTSRCASRMRR